MTNTRIKTKWGKILHDAKAFVWTKAGIHLKKVKTHPKVIDKVLIQDNSTICYINEFEKRYYNSIEPIDFFHPKTYLYSLKDVWVVGSESSLFFEPDHLFSVCSSIKDVKERKIRRPIKSLAMVIEEPVFILSNRAPGNRGHFLVEHLPRLIASMDIIKRFGGCKILVTPRHRKWQVDYLQKLKIPASQIIEASIGTSFCKRAFYVPLLCKGKIATVTRKKYYKTLRNSFINSVKSSEKRVSIFLSRKDAPDRKLANEDAVFSIAKIFFPEIKKIVMSMLTLDEQISLFKEASVIIGPHSQPFRDILFSSNAVVVQLIQGHRIKSNEYYKWAQNYNYVGGIGKNLCLPLFSEIEFNTNSDWIYPEDKFKKDITKLLLLLNKEKVFSYEV